VKAQVLTAWGEVSGFELRELPRPDPGPGHVVVRVAATSVNPVDCKLRRHGSESAPLLPAVLGADFSGWVVAIAPDVDRLSVGEEVYGCGGGLRGLPGGALAEYLPVDARLVARKPRRLTHREAAALPLVAITAMEGLDRAGVRANDHVLVRGGTGGVGHVVVQLAKARGARVLATVSSPERAAIAMRLGADATADHTRETPAAMRERCTGGRGFDVVFDASGGNDLGGSIAAARRGGQVVVIAGTGMHDIRPLYAAGQSLHCVLVLLPLLYREGRDAHGAMLDRIAALADDGRLTPLVDPQVYRLGDTALAHQRVEEGVALGKVVITVAGA